MDLPGLTRRPLNSWLVSPLAKGHIPGSLTLAACLQQALDINPPRSVQKTVLERSKQRMRIDLHHAGPVARLAFGATTKRHDARWRAWRHVDFFEYRIVLTAEVPR